jgi:uncharacterized Rmd1/YagE family protein
MRCTAFCQAASYRLNAISSYFRSNGYLVKPYRKVLHITPITKQGDIFIFSYGCSVAWGLKKNAETQLLKQLETFSTNLLPTMEVDRFVYKYGDHTEMMTHDRFNTDIIILESDSVPLKLAISYGLAQSVQLESYESAVQKNIEANAHLPEQLAEHGAIRLSQKAISKRMGEIFIARSSINLNSEYLSAPEYFWEYPSLETYYSMSEKFLDINRRVATLNQKLDVLHELFDMFVAQLQYKRSNILEMIIIILIFIEIAISVFSMKFH